MTVNELEQAIRNLIASQPMITSGASGEMINSVLSVVYSFREFAFRLQNHPFQDALKVNMLNVAQKVENDLVISVCQMMQERGINLMLYAPQSQFNATGIQANYQMPPQNMAMGQMMYGPQVSGFGMNNPSQPPQMFGGPQQSFGGEPQPVRAPERPRKIAPNPERAAMPGIAPAKPPIEKKPKPEIIKNDKPGPKPTPKEPPKPGVPAAESDKKQVVESLVGEFQGDDAPPGSAAGRDYLLELLKK